MERGEEAYERLVQFVADNIDHYATMIEDGRMADVVESAYYTMNNVAMYDDCDDAMKMTEEDMLDALQYVAFDRDAMHLVFERRLSIYDAIGYALEQDL